MVHALSWNFVKRLWFWMVCWTTLHSPQRALLHHGTCRWCDVLRWSSLLGCLPERFETDVLHQPLHQPLSVGRCWHRDPILEKDVATCSKWFSLASIYKHCQSDSWFWNLFWKGTSTNNSLWQLNPNRGFECQPQLSRCICLWVSCRNRFVSCPRSPGSLVYSERTKFFNEQSHADSCCTTEEIGRLPENHLWVLHDAWNACRRSGKTEKPPKSIGFLRSIAILTGQGIKPTARSTSCGLHMLNGSFVYASSRTQRVVSLSSGEAELHSMVSCLCDGIDLKRCIQFVMNCQVEHYLLVDSSSARQIALRLGPGKLKHVAGTNLMDSASCSRGFCSVSSSWNNVESQWFGNKALRWKQTSFFAARNQYVKWIRYSCNWRGRISTSSQETWVSETCWFACKTSCASHVDDGPWAYRWHFGSCRKLCSRCWCFWRFVTMCIRAQWSEFAIHELSHGASFAFAFLCFCWLVWSISSSSCTAWSTNYIHNSILSRLTSLYWNL